RREPRRVRLNVHLDGARNRLEPVAPAGANPPGEGHLATGADGVDVAAHADQLDGAADTVDFGAALDALGDDFADGQVGAQVAGGVADVEAAVGGRRVDHAADVLERQVAVRAADDGVAFDLAGGDL